MKILAIDVGGTHVKIPAPDQKQKREIVSGPRMTARQMVSSVKKLARGWAYDVVSVGFPGPVLHNRPVADPPSFMVLFEDSAALAGILVAFTGIYLSMRLDLPVLDGVGSILIGLILGVTAWLLANETKSLLIGERADPAIVDSTLHVAGQIDGVTHANGVLTVHLAPQEILVALSLEFADELRTPEIEARVFELERCVRRSHPEVIAVFVKPQSPEGFRETAARRFGKHR